MIIEKIKRQEVKSEVSNLGYLNNYYKQYAKPMLIPSICEKIPIQENVYKNKIHYAQYGNTILKRMYCQKCKRYALVVGGEIQCCDTPIGEFKTHNVKVMSEARSRRQKPSHVEQKEILERQKNKCMYCNIEFGTLMWSEKRKKAISLKKHFDHIVPYSYSYDNKKVNFVAACHICNTIKSNKMFETIEDVSHYVLYHRIRKGYRLLEELEDS